MMVEPFRIFCGWDSRQAEAADVFLFAVREHATCDVRLEFVGVGIAAVSMATSWAIKRTGVTHFTYARFLVPWICGYEGRALFADGCDMLCLGDVAELAEFDMGDHAVCVVKHGWEHGPVYPRPRSWTSLMLMDCARLKCWTPEVVETAPDAALMRFGAFPEEAIGELDPVWNMLCDVPGEPPEGAKIGHWSALSDPDGGSWITRSGSQVWAEARERWKAAR